MAGTQGYMGHLEQDPVLRYLLFSSLYGCWRTTDPSPTPVRLWREELTGLVNAVVFFQDSRVLLFLQISAENPQATINISLIHSYCAKVHLIVIMTRVVHPPPPPHCLHRHATCIYNQSIIESTLYATLTFHVCCIAASGLRGLGCSVPLVRLFTTIQLSPAFSSG